MKEKIIETNFGKFTFLNDYTVVAEANFEVEIDRNKAMIAIELINDNLSGDYALILDRKNDYSFLPVEVYGFFSSIQRIKKIVIVNHNKREVLPDRFEDMVYKDNINRFESIEKANEWLSENLEN